MLKSFLEMITQKKFMVPLAGVCVGFIMGKPEESILLATAFIGAKGIMDATINFQVGKSSWTENWLLQLILSKIWSTKIWMLLVAGGLGVYFARTLGYVDIIEPLRNMVIVYLSAETLEGAIPFVKGANLDFLKKKPAPPPAPEPVEGVDYHQKFIDPPKPEVKPIDPRPPYVAFDGDEWPDDPQAIREKAIGTICWYAQQAFDFMFRWDEVHRKRFEQKFGFPIGDEHKHFNDKKFVKCEHGVNDLDTFLYGLEPDFRGVHRDTMTAISVVDNFFITVSELGEDWIEARLKRGNTRYDDLFVFYTIPLDARP